jgi:hypothetical protein
MKTLCRVIMVLKKMVKYLSSTYVLRHNQIATSIFKNVTINAYGKQINQLDTSVMILLVFLYGAPHNLSM